MIPFISCCNCSINSSKIDSLVFIPIPYNDPDIIAPGRGTEQWYNFNQINIPWKNISSTSMDKYWRFNWAGLNPNENEYNWSFFDLQINAAIDAGQKFSFGIMTQYPEGRGSEGNVIFEGASSAYPEWLHSQMQSEQIKDWTYNSDWIPNWNSEYYLKAWEKFNIALNDHLSKGSYKEKSYKNIINYIDIRGYGSWGEWHSYPWAGNEPNTGQKATAASLLRIIKTIVNAYPDFQLIAMSSGFGSDNYSDIPLEVSYYLLTGHNNKNVFGWRRDNWGDPAIWHINKLEKNPNSYNGDQFSELILNKWKHAPIVGEPSHLNTKKGGNCEYWQLKEQVERYHVTSFGNGNLESVSACASENIRAASKASGYRLILTSGNVEFSNQELNINLSWKNTGVSPTYEDWEVIYTLLDSNKTSVWKGTSSFNPRLFIGTKEITDKFSHLSLPEGYYTLIMTIKDPFRYRSPLPLAIKGRNEDGSYTVTNIAVKSAKMP